MFQKIFILKKLLNSKKFREKTSSTEKQEHFTCRYIYLIKGLPMSTYNNDVLSIYIFLWHREAEGKQT